MKNRQPVSSEPVEEKDEELEVAKSDFLILKYILWGGAISFVMMLIAFYLVLYLYLNPYVKQELIRTINQSTDSLYVMDVEKLNIRFFRSTIDVQNARLKRNPERWEEIKDSIPSNSPKNLDIDFKINRLQARGIHWLAYLRTGEMTIEQIALKDPNIHLDTHVGSPKSENATPLAQQIQSFVNSFAGSLGLDKLIIENLELDLALHMPNQESYHEGHNLYLELNGLDIQTDPQKKAADNITFESFQINSDSYEYQATGSLHKLRVGALKVSSRDSTLSLKNLELAAAPPGDSLDTLQKVKDEALYLDLKAEEINANKVNLYRIIYQQEFSLGTLSLNSLNIHADYQPGRKKNKQKPSEEGQAATGEAPPRPEQPKKQLKDILRDLPFFVEVDTFRIANAALEFNQFDKEGNQVISYHHVDSIDLCFAHLVLGKAITEELGNRPLYSRSVELRFKNYEYQTPNRVYKVFVKEALVSSIDSIIQVSDAQIEPLISEETFSQYTPFQEILINAKIKTARATQLDIERMAYRQEFSMGTVYLDQPSFGAYLDKRKPKRPAQEFQNFEEILKTIPLFIQIRTLAIQNASVNYKEQTEFNDGKGFAVHKADNINLRIQRIELGQAFNRSALAEIDTKSLQLSIEDYEYLSPDGLYQLTLDKLDVSSTDSYISIDSLRLKPRVTDKQFGESQQFRYSIARISADNIQGRKVDFKKLLLYQEVDWGYLHLDYPHIQIYADKRKPKRPPRRDSLYFQRLKRLKMLDKDTSASKSRLLVKLMDLYRNQISSEERISKAWFKEKLPFNNATRRRPIRVKDTEMIRKKLLSSLAYPPLPRDSILTAAANDTIFYDDERSYRNLTDTTGLRSLLREIPAYIKIDTFEVNQATVIYREHDFAKRGSGVSYHYSDSINFIVPQIRLGRATQDSTFRHFYSGNFLLTMRTYLFKDKEDKFLFTLRGIESSLKDSTLLAKQLEMRPLSEKGQFVEENPYRSTYVRAKLQSIRMDAIDIDRLVFDQEFVLNSLYIKKPFLDLYTDKRKPRRPNFDPKTAEELLRAIPVHIKIDTFAVEDASLKFGSLVQSPQEEEPGLAQHELGHIDIFAQQIELALDKASGTREKADNLLYSGRIVLDARDYKYTTPDNLYQISFDKLYSSINDSLVNVQKLRYKPLWNKEQYDSVFTYRKGRYDVEVEEVEAHLSDIRSFLNNTAYDLNALNFNNVKVDIYQNNTLPKKPKVSKKNIQEMLQDIPYVFKVDTLEVNNAAVLFTQKIRDKNNEAIRENRHQADSINISFHNVVIDSTASNDRLLFSDDIRLGLRNYITKTPDSLYQITLDKLEGSTLESFVHAKGFEIKPTVPDFAFTYIKKYQTDRFIIQVNDVETREVDFRRLLNSQEVFLDALSLDGLSIDIYRDKRSDPNPFRIPTMPHEAFKKIPVSIKVDTISIQNGKAVYKERVPKGVGVGQVFFTEIDGKILDLDTRAKMQDTTRVSIRGLLMDEGLLQAELKIPLKADSLYCNYQGRLGSMEATFFNSMIESNEHVRIKKGFINEVDFNVSLKDTVATGTLSAGYKRLKIQVLNEEDHDKKRGFLTFLANMILKSRNNIERKRYKVGEVDYIRQEKDGFMKILWKSLSTGLVDTLK